MYAGTVYGTGTSNLLQLHMRPFIHEAGIKRKETLWTSGEMQDHTTAAY